MFRFSKQNVFRFSRKREEQGKKEDAGGLVALRFPGHTHFSLLSARERSDQALPVCNSSVKPSVFSPACVYQRTQGITPDEK